MARSVVGAEREEFVGRRRSLLYRRRAIASSYTRLEGGEVGVGVVGGGIGWGEGAMKPAERDGGAGLSAGPSVSGAGSEMAIGPATAQRNAPWTRGARPSRRQALSASSAALRTLSQGCCAFCAPRAPALCLARVGVVRGMDSTTADQPVRDSQDRPNCLTIACTSPNDSLFCEASMH